MMNRRRGLGKVLAILLLGAFMLSALGPLALAEEKMMMQGPKMMMDGSKKMMQGEEMMDKGILAP